MTFLVDKSTFCILLASSLVFALLTIYRDEDFTEASIILLGIALITLRTITINDKGIKVSRYNIFNNFLSWDEIDEIYATMENLGGVITRIKIIPKPEIGKKAIIIGYSNKLWKKLKGQFIGYLHIDF